MQITRVTIDNWRNFRRLDVSIQSRLVVIGPNASGKSNFLDIFRFLHELVTPGGGLASAVTKRGGVPKIRSLFARNHQSGRVQIKIELVDGSDIWSYFLSFKNEQAGHRRPVVIKETVTLNSEVLVDRPDADDLVDPELLTQTHLEQITANREFRQVAVRLRLTSYLHLVPQIVRDPSRIIEREDDPFGSDVIAQMNATPQRSRDARLRRMEKALRSAVPQFESLEITTDASGRPHLRAGYRNWMPSPAHQTEADFSDGTLRLIGLLWTLAKIPDAGGTLLLEEPELSLSPEIVRVLPEVLASAQRTKEAQIILTTHASELLDDEGVNPGEVLVLTVTDNGTEGFVLSERAELVTEIESGIPTSDVVRPFVRPERIDGLSRLDLTGRSR